MCWIAISAGSSRADATIRASVGTGGVQSNNFSGSDASALSSDGSIVAFGSIATNLVSPDLNGTTRDVFVHDIATDTTELVSLATDGTQASGISNRPAISGDGQFVAFESLAANLVGDDTNGQRDVFLRDRQSSQTTRVSVATGGAELLGESQGPALSLDGRFVVFTFRSRTATANDILVYDRTLGVTTTMDVGPLGDEGVSFSSRPAISATGRFVAFQSTSQTLVSGTQNQRAHIYVRDRDADGDDIFDEIGQPGGVTTERASVSSDGTLGTNDSRYPSISGDGRFVVFQSQANNLVPSDTCNRIDVFVRDRQLGTTTRLSVAAAGTNPDDLCGIGANQDSTRPVISGDGRRVIFQSLATDLILGDTNGLRDIFVRDRDPDLDGLMDEADAVTMRVSVDSVGNQANGASGSTDFRPAISHDGQAFAFGSEASNLISGDTNESRDVFVRLPTTCGDGIPTPGSGEECDDGNLVDGDGCDSNCMDTACGNSITTAGEACDDGNLIDGDGCDSNCAISGCGNGAVSPSEVCDDGNAVSGDGCDSSCRPTGCGSAVVTGDEICDDGNQTSGDGCDSNCRPTSCGNGIVTSGEQCDDGNTVSGDTCDANCTLPVCGNGVMSGTEQCDDGNLLSGDGCDANCALTGCGNGVVTDGEACDDGNVVGGDGCSSMCQLGYCGDGQVGEGEICDDDNLFDGDGCDANCKPTGCGNGRRTGSEVCDDGNLVDGDGCDANCTLTGCGNGVSSLGEQCDDGNVVSGDGCDATCRPTGCGSGVVTGIEQCDLGSENGVVGSGCGATCEFETTAGLSLYATAPCRLRDTRPGAAVGGAAHLLAPGEVVSIPLTENVCGLPLSARAVVVNVIAIGPTAPGFFTIFPTNETIPTASTINFRAGQVRTNNAIVKTSPDGRGISIHNGSPGSVHLVVDTTGFFQ